MHGASIKECRRALTTIIRRQCGGYARTPVTHKEQRPSVFYCGYRAELRLQMPRRPKDITKHGLVVKAISVETAGH